MEEVWFASLKTDFNILFYYFLVERQEKVGTCGSRWVLTCAPAAKCPLSGGGVFFCGSGKLFPMYPKKQDMGSAIFSYSSISYSLIFIINNTE